jgi:pimeloyl-ACP methyl ester carboxylesterase
MAGVMKKPVRRIISQSVGISVSATLATLGIIALRHALETPQPLKSQLPGEALLYIWRRRSIFYKVLGSVDAPPLVLLHTPEIGASAYEMQQIIEPLAQTYQVYAPDLLGFGLSDRPSIEYSATMYTELCQDFLRDVVKQPATLFASELSCNYAVSVASSTPELCASLVLISPLALHGDIQQQSSLREYAEQPVIKALLYPLLTTRLAFLLTHREQADFAQFYATTHQLGAEHAAMALVAGKLNEDTARQFETLCQPVLLIWGTHALENQRYITSLHDTTQNRQARTVELIQGAGLFVHQEQPESVIAALRRWQTEATSLLPTTAETQTETVASAILPAAETEAFPTLASAEPVRQAYCVKCRKKTAMENASEFIMKNGRRAVRGTCAICGTSITRIGGLS